MVLALLACGTLGIATKSSPAAEPQAQGTNTPEAKESALQAIPYQELDDAGREKVDAVLSNVTIFRRMPIQVIRCDPEMYQFMITHPDVTVNIWEVLGISNVSLSRTGPNTFRADDGSGTQSDIEFLYRSDDTHLIYAVGSYEGSLFTKPVKGGCLLLLKTGYVREPDGTCYITSRLDAFFRVDHAGVELVTKTFQPLVGKAADYNFVESLAFLSQLNRASETRPQQIERLSDKLTKVRDEDRRQFARIVGTIARRFEERGVRTAGGTSRPKQDQVPVPIASGDGSSTARGVMGPPKLRR
jgi:hypothetical protein